MCRAYCTKQHATRKGMTAIMMAIAMRMRMKMKMKMSMLMTIAIVYRKQTSEAGHTGKSYHAMPYDSMPCPIATWLVATKGFVLCFTCTSTVYVTCMPIVFVCRCCELNVVRGRVCIEHPPVTFPSLECCQWTIS